MNPTVRLALALFAGIIAAFITVMLIETAGHAIYPTPQGLNQNDAQALRAYIDALPLGAKLFVLAAWLAGTVDGNRSNRDETSWSRRRFPPPVGTTAAPRSRSCPPTSNWPTNS